MRLHPQQAGETWRNGEISQVREAVRQAPPPRGVSFGAPRLWPYPPLLPLKWLPMGSRFYNEARKLNPAPSHRLVFSYIFIDKREVSHMYAAPRSASSPPARVPTWAGLPPLHPPRRGHQHHPHPLLRHLIPRGTVDMVSHLENTCQIFRQPLGLRHVRLHLRQPHGGPGTTGSWWTSSRGIHLPASPPAPSGGGLQRP